MWITLNWNRIEDTCYKFLLFLISPAARTAIIIGLLGFSLSGSVLLYAKEYVIDYWFHAAAIRDLSLDFVNPGYIYTRSEIEPFLYTPYHVFWAAVARVTHIHVYHILTIAALTNYVIFYVGCRNIAKRILSDVRLDVIVLVVFLAVWNRPLNFSGFYNLGHLPNLAMNPSFFSFSLILSLLSISWTRDLTKPGWICTIAALFWSLFTIHAISTTFFGVAMVAMVTYRTGFKPSVLAKWAGAVLLFSAITFLWPYYSVWGVIFGPAGSSELGGGGDFYADILGQIGPALLGFLGFLALKARPDARYFLYLFAALTGLYTFHFAFSIFGIFDRYLIYMTFALHCLLLSYLAGVYLDRSQALGTVGILLAVLILLIGQAAYATFRWNGLFLTAVGHISPNETIVNRVRGDWVPLAKWLCKDVGIVADLAVSLGALAHTNATLLAGSQFVGIIPDMDQRWQANLKFMELDATLEQRLEIMRRFGMKYVLVPRHSPVADQLRKQMVLLFDGSEYALFSPTSAEPACLG